MQKNVMVRLMAAGSIILMLQACGSAIKVQTDLNPEANLKKYRTFRFQEEESYIGPNFTMHEQEREKLKAAIVKELESRDYVYAQTADFTVDLKGRMGLEQDLVPVNYPVTDFYGRRYPGWYVQGDEYRTSNETTLIINLLDSQNKILLWQGVATGKLSKRQKQQENLISELVDDIFTEFPVQDVNQ